MHLAAVVLWTDSMMQFLSAVVHSCVTKWTFCIETEMLQEYLSSHHTHLQLVAAPSGAAPAADENEKQEPEILDGPRKRKVRFDITAAADDADLDEPPPPGAKPGRGRGRGRRGRPPRGAAAAAAAAGRAAAAAASGAAAYDGAGYNAGAYGGQDPGLSGRPVAYPGNMLPGPDAQGLDQQQMYGGWLPGGM